MLVPPRGRKVPRLTLIDFANGVYLWEPLRRMCGNYVGGVASVVTYKLQSNRITKD